MIKQALMIVTALLKSVAYIKIFGIKSALVINSTQVMFDYLRQNAGVKIISKEKISSRPNSIANVQIQV